MKISIDTGCATLQVEEEGVSRKIDLYSKEAFEIVSQQWVRIGWSQKYQYTFSWLGRPVIQLPEDMIRVQEVIFKVMPDVIVETGVAHGGSLIFYAGLCKILGKGQVIGVDIMIRGHNRQAIEKHFLASLVTLIEGSSTDPEVVERVRNHIRPGDRVLVLLDSDHTKDHVLGELEAYGPLVTGGSYLVATDGIMQDLHDVPRGQRLWKDNNPLVAVSEFLSRHPEFVQEQLVWPFNESNLDRDVTHWPGAWLRRRPTE